MSVFSPFSSEAHTGSDNLKQNSSNKIIFEKKKKIACEANQEQQPSVNIFPAKFLYSNF